MSPRTAAIIAAAGSGTRMQSPLPKQFLEIGGEPVLVHSIRAFSRCKYIDQIVVVVAEDRVASTERMLRDSLLQKPISVICGGRRRQDSVRNGLDRLADDIDIVLVHDGARPLVSEALIGRCYEAIRQSGAAVAAVQVTDTLKREDADQCVLQTVARHGLWQAQTPQGARRELLERAYQLGGDTEVTDESALLENAGIPVRIVAGEEANIKITRQQDLMLAQSIMQSKSMALLIGHGFDAHRLAEGRKLVLGGVDIDHPRGLAGHSDADVVCHALCDAVLGAAGSGDIGRHFPDSDERFKGISSLVLLDRVVELASGQGLRLINGDITIVCQVPKLAPYLEKMRDSLAAHCRVAAERLNIKATTTEKMGYTGREEGISCHAVVLLEKR